MAVVIPRPIRDIVMGPLEIQGPINQVNKAGPGSLEAALVGTLGGGALTLPPAERMVKAVGRVALAIIGSMALYTLGGSAPVAMALGSVVSLPAVAVAGGSWMLYYGATAAIGAVASSSFATLGIGLAYIAGGWIALELHDLLPFGLGEVLLNQGAEAAAPSIVKLCMPAPTPHR